jgi:hypothetical protein
MDNGVKGNLSMDNNSMQTFYNMSKCSLEYALIYNLPVVLWVYESIGLCRSWRLDYADQLQLLFIGTVDS